MAAPPPVFTALFTEVSVGRDITHAVVGTFCDEKSAWAALVAHLIDDQELCEWLNLPLSFERSGAQARAWVDLIRMCVKENADAKLSSYEFFASSVKLKNIAREWKLNRMVVAWSVDDSTSLIAVRKLVAEMIQAGSDNDFNDSTWMCEVSEQAEGVVGGAAVVERMAAAYQGYLEANDATEESQDALLGTEKEGVAKDAATAVTDATEAASADVADVAVSASHVDGAGAPVQDFPEVSEVHELRELTKEAATLKRKRTTDALD